MRVCVLPLLIHNGGTRWTVYSILELSRPLSVKRSPSPLIDVPTQTNKRERPHSRLSFPNRAVRPHLPDADVSSFLRAQNQEGWSCSKFREEDQHWKGPSVLSFLTYRHRRWRVWSAMPALLVNSRPSIECISVREIRHSTHTREREGSILSSPNSSPREV